MNMFQRMPEVCLLPMLLENYERPTMNIAPECPPVHVHDFRCHTMMHECKFTHIACAWQVQPAACLLQIW